MTGGSDTWMMIGIGGFLGAIARYCMSQYIGGRFSTSIPYGTLTVNLLGSFTLGWLLGSDHSPLLFHLLGTGFLGAFTTFSTLSVELIGLIQRNQWKPLIIYCGASYVGGIVLAFLGYVIRL